MRTQTGIRERLALSFFTLVLLVGGMTAVVVAAPGGQGPTRGPIPVDAMHADGTVDLSLVPDYVPALARDGALVGWVTRADALGAPPLATELGGKDVYEVPVYADDLETQIGTMVDGRGFVPAGTDPASVRAFEVVEEEQ